MLVSMATSMLVLHPSMIPEPWLRWAGLAVSSGVRSEVVEVPPSCLPSAEDALNLMKEEVKIVNQGCGN